MFLTKVYCQCQIISTKITFRTLFSCWGKSTVYLLIKKYPNWILTKCPETSHYKNENPVFNLKFLEKPLELRFSWVYDWKDMKLKCTILSHKYWHASLISRSHNSPLGTLHHLGLTFRRRRCWIIIVLYTNLRHFNYFSVPSGCWVATCHSHESLCDEQQQHQLLLSLRAIKEEAACETWSSYYTR